MNRVENRICEAGTPRARHGRHRAAQRIQVARLLWDQYRNRVYLIRNPQGALLQAEQIVGAGVAAARQILGIQGVNTDLMTLRAQCVDGVLEMRK